MSCFYKKQIGFTLIEMMVVCLLISILLGIGIPSYINARYKADKQKGVFNLYQISQAQKMYYFRQEPRTYATDIGSLSPLNPELSEDDGTWTYQSILSGPDAYIVTASHMVSGGVSDGYSLAIDQTGSIDDSNWPY